MIKKFKKQKGLPREASAKWGFTVLESIIAIAILSLSISGAFSAIQQSLSQATIAKDEVKAFYLAQEAVEIIRNIRDNNQLAKMNDPDVSWLDGIAGNLGDPCDFNKICRADVSSFSLEYCGDAWGSCTQNLKQNPDTFLYGYTSGTDTNFKREIQIESINTNEIAVIVKITWTKGVLTQTFKVKTHLFNWI